MVKKSKEEIQAIVIMVLITLMIFIGIVYPLIRYNLHPIQYYGAKMMCTFHINPAERAIEYHEKTFNETFEEGKEYMLYCNMLEEDI